VTRRNRVDPWGDLHAAAGRGLFTGNRGCLVDDQSRLVRHHRGSLWITCVTRYRDWRHPLDAPRTWTPLFFLDDAVALAAGHRPCGLCRRDSYLDYQGALTAAIGSEAAISAAAINRRLAKERLRRGGGLNRANDRILWQAPIDDLPVGTVVLDPADGQAGLLTESHLQRFSFAGWQAPRTRPAGVAVNVLTPPSSVAALRSGFEPTLHPSAQASRAGRR
jgi:hypothetical protein